MVRTVFRSTVVVGLLTSLGLSAGEPFMVLDFREGLHGWTGNARVSNLAATGTGMTAVCTGEEDPWLEGPPPPALPAGEGLRLTIRMRTDGDSAAELFYGPSFQADRSVRFTLNPDGQFHDYLLRLPPLPENSRLRIDPGHTGGTVTVATIVAQTIRPIAPLAFPAPTPSGADFPHRLESGPLALRHTGAPWNGFRVAVGNTVMGEACAEARIGYQTDEAVGLLRPDRGTLSVERAEGTLILRSTVRDAHGATWVFSRRFDPVREGAGSRGAIRVSTGIRVDQQRDIYHLPWVTLFAGLGSHGATKTQALLPGVEYLSDEPSSSEADVEGAKAQRRLLDDVKLCIPMMAIAAEGNYMGLAWDRADHPAPLFDSPDRVYGSEAHVLGLWHPGVGDLRDENALSVHDTFRLEPDTPLRFTFTLFGGKGATVVPAVQQWVGMNGVPPIPEFEGGLPRAVDVLAAGWLDSAAKVGPRWRHAVWGDRFNPKPAADAAAFMEWLAAQSKHKATTARLTAAAAEAIEAVDGNINAAVSHVPLRPLTHLLYGDLSAHVAATEADIRGRIARFPKDGIVRYRQGQDRPDYGRTHFADHANGLVAGALTSLVEYACVSGNREVEDSVLAIVDQQTHLYRNTVPRGAQTWEMPLHTPDILASGRLVHIYTLSYLMSGRAEHLEQARYWAWTGVPFIYLDPPVEGPVGLYATTAVLGATNWRAPYWIGLPVQWCGLVYRSALLELARVDAADGAALWRQLADGMTRAGLQMTWPRSDAERQGLLPDFYHLRAQRSDGPAINPGTVQAGLPEAYGREPLLGLATAGPGRVRILAPGEIEPLPQRRGEQLRVRITAWPAKPYDIHLAGLAGGRLTWQGEAPPDTPRRLPGHRCMTVRVNGSGVLVVHEKE